MIYILLLVALSALGMTEEVQQISLPELSKLESLKKYTLNESYKGVAWATTAACLLLGASYSGLQKLAPKFPLLNKLNFIKNNNKVIPSLLLASYILPQIINYTKYSQLATTPNITDFKIKDRKQLDNSYTKFYFSPNPLKVLEDRLLKIDNLASGKQIYNKITETLSKSNFEELLNYLEKNKESNSTPKHTTIRDALIAALGENLTIKLQDLTNDSTSRDWEIIFDLLSKITDNQIVKTYCTTINDNIKTFNKDKLIQTWIKISSEENKENDYNLTEQYELIKKINHDLAIKFSDTYLDQLINELNESNLTRTDYSFINKFAYVFSYLDKTNIEENITKVQKKLTEIIRNSNFQFFIPYCLKTYFSTIIKHLDREKQYHQIFLVMTYYGLHLYIWAASQNDEAFDKEQVTKQRASIVSKALEVLILIKKENTTLFTELITDHRAHLESYINMHNSLRENTEIQAQLQELEIE